MSIEIMRSFFLWCTIINSGLLLVWVLMFLTAGDWIFQTHGRWFRLEKSQFHFISYLTMALYKIGIFLFNLVPYVALRIIG